MIKRIKAKIEDIIYRKIIRNSLKLSKLGYGLIVVGAEAGSNFEHMYNNRPQGSFIVGKYFDKALLNLPAVKATRGRKEDVKKILWNEILNNKLKSRKTRVLDLASGAGRYLRELGEEHKNDDVESICIDKDKASVKLGRLLAEKEDLKNIRFFRSDIFRLAHLRDFSKKLLWSPNVIIASGLFIYFNDDRVKKMLCEIYEVLPNEGIIIFSSYEKLNTRKLMRKTMATSDGKEWTLYYRTPEFWRCLLHEIGYKDIFILRDQWGMNNVCRARKNL